MNNGLATKFHNLINEERNTPKNFDCRKLVVRDEVAWALLSRIRQLENECDKEIGYVPGKPKGKEHRSWREIFGI